MRDGVIGCRAASVHDLAAERLVTFMRCHTAEEYFAALDVGYEPRVLAVSRLPILRMFATELARIERPDGQRTHAEQDGPSRPAQLDPVIRLSLYRDALRRSYAAFVRVGERAERRGAVGGDIGGDFSGDSGGDFSGDSGGDFSGDFSGDSGGDLPGDSRGGRRAVAALVPVPEAFIGVDEIMIERTREGRP